MPVVLGRVLPAVLAIAIVGSLWWVQAPPRSADSYRERAAATLESLRSHVQTARLWEQSEQRDDAFRTSATVGLEEAEADANKTASKFEGYEPPSGTDDIRSEVSAVATDTTDLLSRLRIAAHRGDWDAVHENARSLEPLAERLEQLAKAARP